MRTRCHLTSLLISLSCVLVAPLAMAEETPAGSIEGPDLSQPIPKVDGERNLPLLISGVGVGAIGMGLGIAGIILAEGSSVCAGSGYYGYGYGYAVADYYGASACYTDEEQATAGILMAITGFGALAGSVPMIILGAIKSPADPDKVATTLVPSVAVGPSNVELTWSF